MNVYAIVQGFLLTTSEENGELRGRIVDAQDSPIQFIARRERVKKLIREMDRGEPICLAGKLLSFAGIDRRTGRANVLHEIHAQGVLTAFPDPLDDDERNPS